LGCSIVLALGILPVRLRLRPTLAGVTAAEASITGHAPGSVAMVETVTKIPTTTIGSFPKPDYVSVRDWFQRPYAPTFDAFYFDNRDLETRFALATKAAVTAQIDAGVDVPTDGEMRREHCIFCHLRHLSGVDFEHLQLREIRTGA
jgi:hypothetical protein